VTPPRAAHTIGYVPVTIATCRKHPARPTDAALAIVLTRRRAVDFCRVATAICCPQDPARIA
jgi:hypothetical protein